MTNSFFNTAKKTALTALAVVALSTTISTQASAQAAAGRYVTEIPYRVVGVAYNDVLNMRAGPGRDRRIVNVLRPGQNGIFIRYCSEWVNWCEVEAGTDSGVKIGWVNMHFLAGYAH